MQPISHLKTSILTRNIFTLSLLLVGSQILITSQLFSSTAFGAKFIATMVGGNEVPPVSSASGGYTSFRTSSNDTVIKYKVNITGMTDATGVHIYQGKVGRNGDIIVDLLNDGKKNKIKTGFVIRGNITNFDLTGPMKGKSILELVTAMNNGDAYVNVKTPSHPDGEIRGQVQTG